MVGLPIPAGRFRASGRTAGGIAIAGGALIILQAIFLVPVFWVALVGMLMGAVIAALGASARGAYGHRTALGGALVFLGLASFLAVSGFYLGGVLTVFGGGLLASMGSWGGATWRRSSRGGSFDLGAPCPRCGKPIPTWTSKCPYCGHPDPPTIE